jgi:hypothetical protein
MIRLKAKIEAHIKHKGKIKAKIWGGIKLFRFYCLENHQVQIWLKIMLPFFEISNHIFEKTFLLISLQFLDSSFHNLSVKLT